MKRLFAIILILLIIFMGMYSYRSVINNNRNLKVTEVESIQKYISSIYMWKEVTDEALPKFDNISDAPDKWVWEVVNKNLEKYELTYEDIQTKAEEIFGSNFQKKFPKEGSEFIGYNQEKGNYYTSGMGLDDDEDSFLINKIEKTKKGYSIEVREYIVDYSESRNNEDENSIYDIYINTLEGERIETLKNTDGDTKIIESVKENIDKFSSKMITLIKGEQGKLYVESVK